MVAVAPGFELTPRDELELVDGELALVVEVRPSPELLDEVARRLAVVVVETIRVATEGRPGFLFVTVTPARSTT